MCKLFLFDRNTSYITLGLVWLVWFYGASAIVGYSMPIHFYTFYSISNNSIQHKYRFLFAQTVLFQTIHFSISKQFKSQKTVLFQTIQFSISKQFKSQKTVLFQTIQFSINTQFSFIWPIDQVHTLRARVDLGAMGMKRYSAFPKLQHYWNLTNWFSVISRILVEGGGSYTSAEKQSVYSTGSADWAI